MELEKIFLYRLTHIDNIPHILQYGITHRNSPKANPNFVSVGDQRLIGNRTNRLVRVTNGTDQDANTQQIKLGDFIPFYFGVRMPMLYVIQHGGNFVDKTRKPEELVYLACSFVKIVEAGYTFYFSNGHATDHFTSFYDQSQMKHLPDHLDWDAIKANYWGGGENLMVKRKKQAECLIKEDLAIKHVFGYICYDESAKRKLVTLGAEKNRIKVRSKDYF